MKRINWKRTGVFVCVAVLIMSPFILGLRPFWLGNDQVLQYNAFYDEWERMISAFLKNGTLPLYSFNTFLGNSFYSSKTYYLVGDILFWLVRLFPSIEQGLLWESVIALFFMGVFFSVFLKSFGIRDEHVITWASCLYMLSGTATLYVGQYMFYRFYCVFPLLLWGVEQYRGGRKRLPIALAAFLLFLNSYYLAFPACLFLFLYVPFSWVYHSNRFEWKGIIRFALPLVLYALIGACLAGFLLIPTILFISGNARVGAYHFLAAFHPQTYFGYFLSYLSGPFSLYTDIPYLFVAGNDGHLYWYSLYTGVMTLPCLLSFFAKKRKESRDRAVITVVSVLVISAMIPTLTSLWHGFSEASFRWTFVSVAFDVLIIAVFFDQPEGEQFLRKPAIWSIGIGLLCLLGCLGIGLSIHEYYIHYLYIAGCLALLAVEATLFLRGKKKLVMALTAAECFLSQSLYLYRLSGFHYNYRPSMMSEYVQYLQDTNTDLFYRIYVNPASMSPSSVLNLNQGDVIGYRSSSTYDSTYEPSLKEFIELNGFDWHIISISDPEALRMLGVKYYCVLDESELPKGYSFTYVTDINSFHVYQLDSYRPIGFTYSRFKTSIHKTIDPETGIVTQHDLDWNQELYIPEDLASEVGDIQPGSSADFTVLEHPAESMFYGSVTVPQKQVLFLSIPYSSGWMVYDENYVPMKTYKVQGGFIGVVLTPGEHYLTIQYRVPGLKAGFMLSLAGLCGAVLLLVLDLRKKK